MRKRPCRFVQSPASARSWVTGRPWWSERGWTVVGTASTLFGWRQYSTGHLSSVFEVARDDQPELTLLSLVEREITMLTRATAPRVEGVANGVVDPDLSKRHPTLAAHLCQVAWEDGTPRLPSTLSVFTSDGVFKACLRDRVANICLWVAAKSFGKLADALEAALNDPNTVWRADRQRDGDVASRRKSR